MNTEHPIIAPKKLIEVALPLDAINEAAAREKTIRHGHPSNLHRWWARRPFVSARAVIFAQMVNDPSWKWELENPGQLPPNNIKASWAASRSRLFSIIKELVKWENTSDQVVIEKARAEIKKSWRETCAINSGHPRAAELFDPEKVPAFHDPFAGGGALPLEAQRLGLESYASDLNPVAVLINKAMIEIPPKFSGSSPVNPEAHARKDSWTRQWAGAQGLAEDVRYYGEWMREEAAKRLDNLYRPIKITAEMAKERRDLVPLIGQELNIIAWIWARTVKSPNPAFRHIDVPLASSFVLATREGKQAYIEPIVTGEDYTFIVRTGPIPPNAKKGTKLSRANFQCLMSGVPISGDYIKNEGKAGRIGSRLMAIVAEGRRGRVFLSPPLNDESSGENIEPTWKPELTISGSTQYLGVKPYGMDRVDQLFTNRQLVALQIFSELISDASKMAEESALSVGWSKDRTPLRDGGRGAKAYSEAIAVYLGIVVSKTVDSNTALCPWEPVAQCTRQLFGRQAITMIWDYGEANPLLESSGGFKTNIKGSTKSFETFPISCPEGTSVQADSATQSISEGKVVSTDPPYYDNVPYADLSDVFYAWLRHSLKEIMPHLFQTVSVPKSDELVAFAYRHESKKAAEEFFLRGMTQTMSRIAEQAHAAFPVCIYYAFKQAETEEIDGTASTGWDTFLSAVVRAGLAIDGTWPMRTEMVAAMKTLKNNLASSIVVVCRRRDENAPTVSRRTFVRELNQVLPLALDEMTRGSGEERSPVAPVDLSQAIIGPGMAVFSKYSAVLEADGSAMTVHTALTLINRFLAEDDFDHDTQFCLHWFEQYGWDDGRFGDADTLARAKGTSVDGVKQAGVLFAAAGVVRLLKWKDYKPDWDAEKDERLPIWEALHHLIRVFKTEGESGAGKVLAAIGGKAEATRQLAYRLYTLCERAGWAEDARAYNEIVTSWNAIESAAAAAPKARQTDLFE
jgi:putative DNA methylase